MKHFSSFLVITVLALLLFCSKQEKSDTALIVNGEEISGSLVSETVEFLRRQQLQLSPEKALEEVGDELRQSAARQLVAHNLMLEDIKSRGWSADSSAVEASFSKLKSKFNDEEEFKKSLVSMGESEDSFRDQLAQDILLDSLLKELMDKSDTVSEKECRKHYEEHKKRYVGAPRVRASQILFPFDSSADSAQVESMRRKAQKVLGKAKSGEDFDKLAKSYSTMPMAADIGWLKKGDLIPDLEEVLFSLEIGEVREIMKSNMGFHILKKTDQEAERPLKYREVKDLIRKSIELSRKSKMISSYVDDLISDADIEYIDTTLNIKEASAEKLLLGE
ncbi:MAG: peptidylprolyl isomerase [Chitinispirillaceae bacterium]